MGIVEMKIGDRVEIFNTTDNLLDGLHATIGGVFQMDYWIIIFDEPLITGEKCRVLSKYCMRNLSNKF
jgi:hypothetical protein